MFSKAWQWLLATPSLLKAIGQTIKLFFTFEIGRFYQSIKEDGERLRETNDKISRALSAGNDVGGMSNTELDAELSKRGLLRVRGVQAKRKSS